MSEDEDYMDLPNQISAKTTTKVLMLLCDESVRPLRPCGLEPGLPRGRLGSELARQCLQRPGQQWLLSQWATEVYSGRISSSF